MVLYGQPLLAIAITTRRAVPEFLEKAFKFLLEKHIDDEGIFRIPGEQNVKKKLISFIDSSHDIELPDGVDHNAVCGVITQFIKEIPNCLLLTKNAAKLQNIKTKEDAQDFINTLPLINRVLFSRLMGFFSILITHPKNRMSSTNCSIILSPILVDDPKNKKYILSQDVVKIFIEDYQFVFKDIPAVDSEGKWIEYNDFTKKFGDILEEFFCQSTMGKRVLKTVIYEKEMKMCRKLKFAEKVDPESLAESLLSNEGFGSSSNKTTYQRIPL